MARPFAIPLLVGSGLLLLLIGACDRPEDPAGRGDADRAAPRPEPAPRVDRARSRYKNLQVLPDDITEDELKRTMKDVTKALGVECRYCHRTDQRDYASDEIEKKVVAREMMRMVERIDADLSGWPDAPKATFKVEGGAFILHRDGDGWKFHL
ncbi:MAG: hypothetical protein CMJ18_20530 [Phycisphaeraceae bacterium]|nr:hypothetical protein [Phycisphaeraceae bacterium]